MQCKKLSTNFRVVCPIPSALSSRNSARPLVTFASYAARTFGSFPAHSPNWTRPTAPSQYLLPAEWLSDRPAEVNTSPVSPPDPSRCRKKTLLLSTNQLVISTESLSSRQPIPHDLVISPATYRATKVRTDTSVSVCSLRGVTSRKRSVADDRWPFDPVLSTSCHVSLRYTTRESLSVGLIVHRARNQ